MKHLKPRPNDRNISTQHCCGQHVACVWPPCCDVLRYVACCWLKFENGLIFHVTFVDVVWCCSRLARVVQQCCARACALVLFSTRNMSQHIATGWPNERVSNWTRAPCCAQQCCDLLGSNVAIVWPKLANAGPTMLGYVALRCCYRLAGA